MWVSVFSVPVSYQERARAFYVEQLGFEVVADATFGPGTRWLQVAPPGSTTTFALVTWFDEMPPGSMRGDRDETTWSDLDRLVELVTEYEVVEVVVGLPRTLAGPEGPAAAAARAYVDDLREVLAENAMTDLPITLADERLTTVSATRMLS